MTTENTTKLVLLDKKRSVFVINTPTFPDNKSAAVVPLLWVDTVVSCYHATDVRHQCTKR